jgi:hypothetical protein
MDYLVADPVVIPSEYRRFHAVTLVYLPFTCQSNDDHRQIVPLSFVRSDHNAEQKYEQLSAGLANEGCKLDALRPRLRIKG